MRLSIIRAGIVAIGATIALAACGGHAMVPSQTGNVPFARPVPQVTTSPCKISGLWYFHGSCKAFTLSSAGGTFKLPAYKGITFTATIGSNTASGKVKFILGDATGKKDITGTVGGKAFPKYGATKCAQAGACPGTPLVYFEAVNTSSATINITGNSKLVVAATSFPGKSCFPGLMNAQGKWTGYSQVAQPVSGGKVSITIPPIGVFYLPPGPAYGVLSCM